MAGKKEKKPKKAKKEKQETAPQKGKKKFLLLLLGVVVLAAAAFVVFRFVLGGKAAPPEPPAAYTLEGDSVDSLNTVLGAENSGTLTKMQTPEDEGGDASGSGANDGVCLYTYEELAAGGDAVRQYMEALAGEDGDFQIVDETGLVTDPPDYAAETGSVAAARAASEDGKILRLDIEWSATGCQITLTRPEGEVTTGTMDVEPMTFTEVADYVKTLSPAKLGLEGTDMSGYSVYPTDGACMVDGNLCVKLYIYHTPVQGEPNAEASTYLISGDKAHLYKLVDGEVQELEM